MRLVPGMRSACSVMSPSSRLGRNSEPRRVAAKPAHATSAIPHSDRYEARTQSDIERRPVEDARARHHRTVLLAHPARHEQRDGGRNEGQRQDERRRQRHDDGDRHRMEHFPFDAGQREDRHIDDGDDQNPDQARTDHFAGRRCRERKSLVPREQAPEPPLAFGKAAQAILDDDHRRIDDEPEIERAETHQIAGDAVLHHAGDRQQHGERNDRGRDQRGPEIAEQQEQHQDDEQRAFEQVRLHRLNGAFDQVGAIVDRPRHDARRQRARGHFQLGGNGARDGAAVLADQHQRGTEHDFPPVLRGGAGAQLLADADVRDIGDGDGNRVPRGDDDPFQIIDGGRLSRHAHEILLAEVLDIARAHVRVVAQKRIDDVGHGEAISGEPRGNRRHVILALEAADRVHVGDARRRAKLRAG